MTNTSLPWRHSLAYAALAFGGALVPFWSMGVTTSLLLAIMVSLPVFLIALMFHALVLEPDLEKASMYARPSTLSKTPSSSARTSTPLTRATAQHPHVSDALSYYLTPRVDELYISRNTLTKLQKTSGFVPVGYGSTRISSTSTLPEHFEGCRSLPEADEYIMHREIGGKSYPILLNRAARCRYCGTVIKEGRCKNCGAYNGSTKV